MLVRSGDWPEIAVVVGFSQFAATRMLGYVVTIYVKMFEHTRRRFHIADADRHTHTHASNHKQAQQPVTSQEKIQFGPVSIELNTYHRSWIKHHPRTFLQVVLTHHFACSLWLSGFTKTRRTTFVHITSFVESPEVNSMANKNEELLIHDVMNHNYTSLFCVLFKFKFHVCVRWCWKQGGATKREWLS